MSDKEWRIGFGDPRISAGCIDNNPGWVPIVADCPPFVFGAVIALTDTREVAEEIIAMRRRLEAAEALARCAEEAGVQLQYLDGRWPTGTTPAVLNRLAFALAAYREASK